MDRMSPQDAIFLYAEDGKNPMHVGSVAIFEGPAPRYGDLIRIVVRKLHLVPRYRQRVRFVPFELGRPVWADDPHFQVLYHVRHTAVAAPGGGDELRNLAGRLLAQHLDRHKPLWELWMVEGLKDDRWAVVSKMHHCMVDGVAATDLMSVIFDRSPHPRPQEYVPWSPAVDPGDLRLVADACIDNLVNPLQRLATLPPLVRAPLRHPRQALDLIAGLAEEWLWPRQVPRSLYGPIGPHRRWSCVKGSLAEVKEVRDVLGGTVNDVVLAAISRGFRELLLHRGEPVAGHVVRTLVPVSVRTEKERGLLTNRVSGFFPDLPIGIADPVQRLAEISRQMSGLKESKQAVAGDALIGLAGFAPAMWLALAGRLGISAPLHPIQTVTTNVLGPQSPLYLGGRRLLDCYPYVPIGGQIRASVAIFSYAGELNFGVTGDYDSVPDLDVLCSGIEKGIAELLAVARRRARGRGDPPGASRQDRPLSGSGTVARSRPNSRHQLAEHRI
jgi:diacylglycerol O-acyltransferase / wax synthase